MWYNKTLNYEEQWNELNNLLSDIQWNESNDEAPVHVFTQDRKDDEIPVPVSSKYKYNETEILEDIQKYIDSTYNQHYIGKNGVQVNDLIIALGHAEGSYVSNAIEYLARYGKKDGKNKKDLLKAIHNIMLLISNDFYTDNPEGL